MLLLWPTFSLEFPTPVLPAHILQSLSFPVSLPAPPQFGIHSTERRWYNHDASYMSMVTSLPRCLTASASRGLGCRAARVFDRARRTSCHGHSVSRCLCAGRSIRMFTCAVKLKGWSIYSKNAASESPARLDHGLDCALPRGAGARNLQGSLLLVCT